MKKFATLNFRVSRELKGKMEAAANEAGINLTQLLEEAMDLRLNMPEEFLSRIRKVAEEVHLPAAILITNKIIKQITFEFAWLQVFGKPAPSSNLEFRFNGKGLITGDALVEQLTQEFVLELQEAKSKLEDTGGERPFLRYSEFETLFRGLKPKGQ